MLDKLKVPTDRPTVRVKRDFAATPEQVFDAWLDPETVGRWMAPGPFAARARIEARVGGRYRVTHSAEGRRVGGFDATILELDRPKRLVFAWGFVGPEGEDGPRYDSRLTIILDPTPSGTRLTLIHERLETLTAALPEVAENVGRGWEDVLGKLARLVE